MAIHNLTRKKMEPTTKTSSLWQRENHVVSLEMALQQLRVTVKNIRLAQSRLEFLMDDVREVIDRRGY